MSAVPLAREIAPLSGQLWRSRPPLSLLARVLYVSRRGRRVQYQLLGDDGAPLCDPVIEALEDWWACFEPT